MPKAEHSPKTIPPTTIFIPNFNINLNGNNNNLSIIKNTSEVIIAYRDLFCGVTLYVVFFVLLNLYEAFF